MKRKRNYETITKWKREECGIVKERPKEHKNQDIFCLTDMGSACMQ
jgi:hypothetical protein